MEERERAKSGEEIFQIAIPDRDESYHLDERAATHTATHRSIQSPKSSELTKRDREGERERERESEGVGEGGRKDFRRRKMEREREREREKEREGAREREKEREREIVDDIVRGGRDSVVCV